MRILKFLVPFLFLSENIYAGTWTRVNENTLKFEGDIKTGDSNNLYRIFNPSTDRNIIVDSLGGEVKDGVLMGLFLFPYKVKVIVDGVCLSSCANYLFNSAHIKEIKNGWVGYHGNATAFENVLIENFYKENIDWKFIKEIILIKDEIPKSKLEQKNLLIKKYSDFKTQNEDILFYEKIFYQVTNIKQSLFDRSLKMDKGMNDGNIYMALCPKIENFQKYGILNVYGKQNIKLFLDRFTSTSSESNQKSRDEDQMNLEQIKNGQGLDNILLLD